MVAAMRVFLGLSILTFLGTLAAGAPVLAESNKALFAKYPAGPAYKGRPAPVNLRSHKDAPNFRTRLRAAAKKRPNFAGHVIVTNWGCGAGCQLLALIDVRT